MVITTTNRHQLFQPSRMFEYQLVGHPPPAVALLLEQEKQKFSGMFNFPIAPEALTCFTIAKFEAPEDIEPTCNRWLQNICSAHAGFPVILDRYTGCPSHAIYFHVIDPSSFSILAQQLQPVADLISSSGGSTIKVIARPHCTLARQLPAAVYEKAMMFYEEKAFHASFMLDELLLLRREHEYDEYKTVQIFRLKPAVPMC